MFPNLLGYASVHSVRIRFVGIIRVHLGLLGRLLGSSGSFGIALVHSCVLRGRRVHSCSRGVAGERLGVTWFILVRVGSIGRQ